MAMFTCAKCEKEMWSRTEVIEYWGQDYCKVCDPDRGDFVRSGGGNRGRGYASGGVVYLIQAGPYYKIGKTMDFSKRYQQISLQLPFRAEVVHTIGTNDIHSLEQYWHGYFDDRRVNGEWFVLTELDVSEFVCNDYIKMV